MCGVVEKIFELSTTLPKPLQSPSKRKECLRKHFPGRPTFALRIRRMIFLRPSPQQNIRPVIWFRFGLLLSITIQRNAFSFFRWTIFSGWNASEIFCRVTGHRSLVLGLFLIRDLRKYYFSCPVVLFLRLEFALLKARCTDVSSIRIGLMSS